MLFTKCPKTISRWCYCPKAASSTSLMDACSSTTFEKLGVVRCVIDGGVETLDGKLTKEVFSWNLWFLLGQEFVDDVSGRKFS